MNPATDFRLLRVFFCLTLCPILGNKFHTVHFYIFFPVKLKTLLVSFFSEAQNQLLVSSNKHACVSLTDEES
jgi:hypothetical protein